MTTVPTREEARKSFHALREDVIAHLGSDPDQTVDDADWQGEFETELRYWYSEHDHEDIIARAKEYSREREKVAACDALATKFCIRHTDLSAGEIEEMTFPERVGKLREARTARDADD